MSWPVAGQVAVSLDRSFSSDARAVANRLAPPPGFSLDDFELLGMSGHIVLPAGDRFMRLARGSNAPVTVSGRRIWEGECRQRVGSST